MKYRLTDTVIRKATPNPDGKLLKYTDGGGHYLAVTKTTKSWRYDYTRPTGGRNTLVIGTYPELSLREAREKHQEARDLLARGVDPSEYKRALKTGSTDNNKNSFEAIAREWYLRSKDGWSITHKTRVISYLERDVFPWIGKMHINEVRPTHIIRIMQRVEERGAGDAARRVKQFINGVYKYAVTLELADRNPTTDIDNKVILAPWVKKHYATITDPKHIGQLLRDIDNYKGSFVVRIAMSLAPHVMLRPHNIRSAEWAHIDLENSLWRIPVSEMKAPTHIKKANLFIHTVFLSKQVITLFKEIHPLTGHGRYVFPSARGESRALSDNGIRTALRAMGYDNDTMTPHGFRSMASTLLNRVSLDDYVTRRWDADLIEQQLGHVDGSVRGAYNRADSPDALRQRSEMLQYWSDYLDYLRKDK